MFTFIVTGVGRLIGILEIFERNLFTVLMAIMCNGDTLKRGGDEDGQLGPHLGTVRISKYGAFKWTREDVKAGSPSNRADVGSLKKKVRLAFQSKIEGTKKVSSWEKNMAPCLMPLHRPKLRTLLGKTSH